MPLLRSAAEAAVGMATGVEIAGVGIHPFGRFGDTSVVELGVFQAAFCGTVYSGVAAGHKVLTALGMTGIPIVNVEAGCASGGAALALGAAQIAMGRYERVLVLGLEKMPRGMIR